jgi:hypothetical protein
LRFRKIKLTKEYQKRKKEEEEEKESKKKERIHKKLNPTTL